MHPRVTRLQAVDAAVGDRCHVANIADVRALRCHRISLSIGVTARQAAFRLTMHGSRHPPHAPMPPKGMGVRVGSMTVIYDGNLDFDKTCRRSATAQTTMEAAGSLRSLLSPL